MNQYDAYDAGDVDEIDIPRYVLEFNHTSRSFPCEFPWRMYDTRDERYVGSYRNEEDAELLLRFMNGPDHDNPQTH
jgi:hypothetical protein